jgi:hypothetical protein
MTVARRFIAGSGTTSSLRPGGTPEDRRAIHPKDIVSSKNDTVSLDFQRSPFGTLIEMIITR